MKAQKGESLSADFEENTWTFEMPRDFVITAGYFMIVPMEEYAQQQPSESVTCLECNGEGGFIPEMQDGVEGEICPNCGGTGEEPPQDTDPFEGLDGKMGTNLDKHQDVEAMAEEAYPKIEANRHDMSYHLNTGKREAYKAGFNAHNSKGWVSYSWENKKSHPPKAGKYWIYRKGCNKQHSEQWNGSGWSSSNNDCTHWQSLPQPPKD